MYECHASVNLCEEYKKSFGARESDISGLWCLALFLRSVVALEAVIELVHADLNDDAAIIIRTLLEVELQLGVIKEQPELAVEYIKRAEAFRSGRLKAFINAVTEGR